MPERYANIYNDHEHFKHVLDHLFIPALRSANYEVVPPTATGSDLIHAEIIRNLEECHLVLCDISTLNPNVFFELGIRTSLDRPVVLVRDNHTIQIPFDTGSINTYTYEASLHPWILDNQVSRLSMHIVEAATRSGERNSLWRYFGLTQRAAPAEIANPTEAKLDLLVDEITRIGQRIATYSPPYRSEAPVSQDTSKLPLPSISYAVGETPHDVVSRLFIDAIRGRLEPSIPSRLNSFIKDARKIASETDLNLVIKGYSEKDDMLVLYAPVALFHHDQIERMMETAKNSSARFFIYAGD